MDGIDISIDRSDSATLAEQVRASISDAIANGALSPGERLPSWRALASQLGIARGTVRAAYEALADEQLVVADGARGTRVTDAVGSLSARAHALPASRTEQGFPHFVVAALPFQIGVPAITGYPAAALGRLMVAAGRSLEGAAADYPDPCGEPDLRRALATHLGLARGLNCTPSQIFITSGFGSGLNIALSAVRAAGGSAWVEDPGYPVVRTILGLNNVRPLPIPVDTDGLDVGYGEGVAPNAAVAIVSPGQQAPLGVVMTRSRRLALLDWAHRAGAWIIEDDYLGELQLRGRAVPALASLDVNDRTILIGTFSKTISPALRLGFVVTPERLATEFSHIVAAMAPAPNPVIQHAVAAFMKNGQYLRHLRRMKTRYTHSASVLRSHLANRQISGSMAGLAMLVRLDDDTDDVGIATIAKLSGIAPSSLSSWYMTPDRALRGLMLGITNIDDENCGLALDRLDRLLKTYGPPRLQGVCQRRHDGLHQRIRSQG